MREHIHAVIFGDGLNAEFLSRLSKLSHSWPLIAAGAGDACKPYCQRMQNQTNMIVLLSILVVIHNITNGRKRNAPRALIAHTTFERSASGAVASHLSIYGIYGSRSSGGNDVVSILTTCDGRRIIPRQLRLVRTYRRRHFRRWVQCR